MVASPIIELPPRPLLIKHTSRRERLRAIISRRVRRADRTCAPALMRPHVASGAGRAGCAVFSDGAYTAACAVAFMQSGLGAYIECEQSRSACTSD